MLILGFPESGRQRCINLNKSFCLRKANTGKKFLVVYFLLPNQDGSIFQWPLKGVSISYPGNSKSNKNLCVNLCIFHLNLSFLLNHNNHDLVKKKKIMNPPSISALHKSIFFLQLNLQPSTRFLKSGFIASKQNRKWLFYVS